MRSANPGHHHIGSTSQAHSGTSGTPSAGRRSTDFASENARAANFQTSTLARARIRTREGYPRCNLASSANPLPFVMSRKRWLMYPTRSALVSLAFRSNISWLTAQSSSA